MFKIHPFLAPTAAIALACVACGASFTANGEIGGSGGSGEANGGSSSAGNSSDGDAGDAEIAGASSAGAGGTGAGGWGSGRGGRGNGGWGNGGWRAGTAGGSTVADCDRLRQEYEAALEKARLCDKGSTDQCTPSSLAQPVGGCGCPVLVNAKSEHTAAAMKAYQSYQNAKCDYAMCDAFCAPPVTASCAPQSMGPGSSYVCTTAIAAQN